MSLPGWASSKVKIINGSTAGAVTNYQMKITVHKSNGTDTATDVYLGSVVRDDFGDVRFTDSDGTTLLDYWLDAIVSGVSADVWVEVPSIPIDPGTATIFLYYNNPSATTTSNGTNTFLFFDDFSANTMSNYTMFNIGASIPGSFSWDSINQLMSVGSVNTTWHRILYNLSAFNKNVAVAAKLRFDAFGADRNNNGRAASVTNRASLNGTYPDDGDAGGFDSRPVSTPQTRIKWGIDAQITIGSQSYTTGVWYNIEVASYETLVNFFLNNVLNLTGTQTQPVPATGYIGFQIYESNTSWDDLRVRNYIFPEPTFSTLSDATITFDVQECKAAVANIMRTHRIGMRTING